MVIGPLHGDRTPVPVQVRHTRSAEPDVRVAAEASLEYYDVVGMLWGCCGNVVGLLWGCLIL